MQAKLLDIFGRLRTIMKKYEDSLKPKFDMEGKYDLWSFKEVEISGRMRKEVNFASLIVQSRWVGFYYMPIYTDMSLKEFFPERLLRLLKGKSCFRIRELDEELERQIDDVLERGTGSVSGEAGSNTFLYRYGWPWGDLDSEGPSSGS